MICLVSNLCNIDGGEHVLEHGGGQLELPALGGKIVHHRKEEYRKRLMRRDEKLKFIYRQCIRK